MVIRDYDLFTLEELNFLLKETIKVVGNSIPFDATLAMNRKPHQRDETSGYGYMASLEILQGNTTISICCQKADILEKALQRCCHHVHKEMFSMSYFERFCNDDPDFK